MSATRISRSECSAPVVPGRHAGAYRRAFTEGVVPDTVHENGELFRYEEDWHLD